MTTWNRSLMSAGAVAAGLLLAGQGAAQTQAAPSDPSARTVSLDSFLCKDVMRMSGDDRLIATALLHGYLLGKKGTIKYVPAELGKVTDSFTEHCLSNPNDNALEAFTKLAS